MRITVTAARSRRRASQPGSALPGAPDHDGGASSSSHWHGFASRGSGCQAPGHWPPSGSRHARPPASDRAGAGPGLRLGSVARFTVALAGRTAGLYRFFRRSGVLGRCRGVNPHLLGRGRASKKETRRGMATGNETCYAVVDCLWLVRDGFPIRDQLKIQHEAALQHAA